MINVRTGRVPRTGQSLCPSMNRDGPWIPDERVIDEKSPIIQMHRGTGWVVNKRNVVENISRNFFEFLRVEGQLFFQRQKDQHMFWKTFQKIIFRLIRKPQPIIIIFGFKIFYAPDLDLSAPMSAWVHVRWGPCPLTSMSAKLCWNFESNFSQVMIFQISGNDLF